MVLMICSQTIRDLPILLIHGGMDTEKCCCVLLGICCCREAIHDPATCARKHIVLSSAF